METHTEKLEVNSKTTAESCAELARDVAEIMANIATKADLKAMERDIIRWIFISILLGQLCNAWLFGNCH